MINTAKDTTVLDVDKPTVETTPEGGLVVAMQRMPDRFEQVFDAKKMTYTLYASWATDNPK
ncbi:MAG: hypothetical protein V7761_09430 [Amylibacter sp.]